MTTPAPAPVLVPKKGIIKQILSGDSVIIRGLSGAPPPEKQIAFSGVTAPKLARRPGGPSESSGDSKDEPWAWEAREFLRKKLIGEEVLFVSEKPPNTNREYGTIYLGKDINTAENITESLVSEGLVSVRREGVRPTPELTKLWELEDEAKRAGKGKWSDSPASEHIRDVKWSIDNLRAFVDKNEGKPIKAVIEHVRDGSTVRAFLLPDFHYITLMIAGIRCNGFKLDEQGRPDPTQVVEFAEEAKYYVEVRLLQREVDIVLHSVNNANNLIGSISHPKGNIAENLLREGFARCVDWSLAPLKSADIQKLRAAEAQAKAERKRIWKDYQAKAPQITGKEKEYVATVVEVVNGDALQLKLANGTYRKVFLASIRPPREVGRVGQDDDGKPIPRPKGFRPLYDIPWMFEAREYLRKKLIGKKVHVVTDYKQEARDSFPEKICATVTINGKNVAEALVSKGLATVLRYRQDDDQRSSRYDELLKAEAKAEKSQLGIHSKKDGAPLRVTEIDAARAKLELAAFQRAQKIDAIVEFVASGSRLRIYIPRSNSLATFLLGGISCPRASRPATGSLPASEGEEYGDEALQFTKEKCLQREVSIQVDTHDKAGNFIGWLWIDNLNMSVELVKAGFASVHFTGEKSSYGFQLKQAEDSAKSQKLRRWKNYVEEEPKERNIEDEKPYERRVNYEEVVVTEVTSEGTFFVQKVADGPKAESLFAKLRQEFDANPPLPGAYTPKRGDLCAAKFTLDDAWYRVKVEKVAAGKALVHYIDYGNKETLPTTRLASLPAAYSAEKPFAVEYTMPYATLPKDEEYKELALKYLREDTNVPKLYLNVESRGHPQAASLHKDQSGTADIIRGLIADGLLLVDVKGRRQDKLLEDYRAAQEEAKKAHLNIWEYGDITEDDAKEFGLGNLRLVLEFSQEEEEETGSAETARSNQPTDIQAFPYFNTIESEDIIMSDRKWVTEPDVYVCTLSKDTQELALKELREDENSRNSALESMREWIRQNPRIKNCRMDARFLLRFLRFKKFSVEQAKEALERYVLLRQTFGIAFNCLDITIPMMQDLTNLGYMFACPKRDSKGRRVIVARPGVFDLNKFTNADMCRIHGIVYETLMEDEENQVRGFVHFADGAGVGFAYLTLFTIREAVRIVKNGEKTLPMRHKEVHGFNIHPSMKFALDWGMTLISDKIKSRVRLYSNIDEVLEAGHVERDILPKEYGGTMPMAKMIELWKEELRQSHPILMSHDEMAVNEELFTRREKEGAVSALRKQGVSCGAEKDSLCGITGNFRKLEVD